VIPSDGLLGDPALLAVVQASSRRDLPALRGFLEADAPLVRARAALALGGLASAEMVPLLVGLLADPDPRVRREAAFSLGVLPPAGQDGHLAEALPGEEDPGVARAVREALRRLEGPEPLTDDPEAARAALLAPDDAERARAARALGAVREGEGLRRMQPVIREALDRWGGEDAAAMELLGALAALRDPEDLPRLLDHLAQASDWRVRMAAARALGSTAWIEREGVRPALFRALDDPSQAVAATAATALVQGLWVPPHVLSRLADRLSEDPATRWTVHLPTLWQIASFHRAEEVVDWTRRAARGGAGPVAVQGGVNALNDAPGGVLRELLLELSDDADPEIREVGLDGLARSWQRTAGPELPPEVLLERFLEALPRASHALAVSLAGALADLAVPDPRIEEALLAEAEARAAPGLEVVVEAIGRALLHRGDPAGQQLLSTLTEPLPLYALDPERLRALGRHPVLVMETDRGDVRVKLDSEAAPVTVAALWEQAESGAHDGLPFHRVDPGLLVQGGDVSMRNGTGGPGYRLPLEPNWIPFQRGVMGMASLGVPDSGGSQFFLLHTQQPHLEGRFTAVGWVVEGLEVLDRLAPGDRVRRFRVEPEQGRPGGGEGDP
jgi:cyclophilin family peptidyl-prolyl cis-trans isomerase/HEAT repeat protein